METHTVFMDWNTQLGKDVSFFQVNLSAYYNFCQNPERFFLCVDIGRIILKFIRKGKGTKITKTIKIYVYTMGGVHINHFMIII